MKIPGQPGKHLAGLLNASSTTDITSILPPLESIEDVFRVLNAWEDAVRLHEKGLTWSHVSRELGYDKIKILIHLEEIAEERLQRAWQSDLITEEQVKRKLNYFNDLAEKWVTKIYAD